MTLAKIGMLVVDSSRTRAYLDALKKNDLYPAYVLYLEKGHCPESRVFPKVRYFNNEVSSLAMIREMGIPYDIISSTDANCPEVVSKVIASPVEIFIYSGLGGAILKKDILDAGK
ncbi:MAG TPA: hypothetical protein VI387_03815, partial [Candidatus Brocadiales bacterium]|nr:hypothetical protein [Candidatus Brocadiales bacterium]